MLHVLFFVLFLHSSDFPSLVDVKFFFNLKNVFYAMVRAPRGTLTGIFSNILNILFHAPSHMLICNSALFWLLLKSATYVLHAGLCIRQF